MMHKLMTTNAIMNIKSIIIIDKIGNQKRSNMRERERGFKGWWKEKIKLKS